MNPVYQQIDDFRTHACVLCMAGVPGDKGKTLAHHHIVARSELPGDGNKELLWNPVNIAIACQYHHDKFGHIPYRGLWALAMNLCGQSKRDDYVDYPITQDEWDLGYALLGMCQGNYRQGDFYIGDAHLKKESKSTIQSVWFGKSDARLTSFCDHLCSKSARCLQLTRENLRKEIENA